MTPAAWMLGERRGEGEEKLLCGDVFKREAAAIAAAERMTCHWRTVRAVPVYAEQLARPAPPPSWRCFFCDEEFLDRAAAARHFGADEDCEPACQIKASEGGLIKALRDTEEALFDATARLHAESGETLRTWAAVGSRHEAALRSAEEAGFERGVNENRRSIETLRRALAWHGNRGRMATTREEWQQEIDEAIRWVMDNPEPGRPSFSSFDS